MRTSMRFVLVVVATLGLALAGPAPARAAVTVAIEPRAKLVGDGAVRAVVVASCDPGHEVLEATCR